ncbi:sulfatase-like hydrolase/transferase, partial [Candidatus Eisenbacteria bacterium]
MARPGWYIECMELSRIILIAMLCLMLAAMCGAEPEQPNVVLIVVDALRPDHLGCYGYSRPTSPNIDELAAGGIVFETAITQAPWTKASFPSFLTSLYPFQHGVTRWESVLLIDCGIVGPRREREVK